MPLSFLSETFTHYDLHDKNVLIYEPKKNEYIHFHYHINNKIISFKSSYIAKLVDYGRCYFYESRFNNSLYIHEQLCKINACNKRGHCGEDVGYSWLSPLDNEFFVNSYKKNHSHDLRLLSIIRTILNKNNKIKNKLEYLKTVLDKVVFKKPFGTKEENNSFFYIHTVNDAYTNFESIINSPYFQNKNRELYIHKKKIGDLHIYIDKYMDFIPNIQNKQNSFKNTCSIS